MKIRVSSKSGTLVESSLKEIRLNPKCDGARSAQARLAAHSLHALKDSTCLTTNARSSFLARFEREVDPTMTLPPAERARRAEHAKKAYFTKLGIASGKARRNGSV